MNTLIFSDADKESSHTIRINDRRFGHLTQVLKVEVGQQIKVGELNGDMGTATVSSLSSTEAILSINLIDPAPPKLPLSLILALPRPKMLRRILRTVAELGVEELHLINSYRVEKSYWQTPVLSKTSLDEYFLQGLEQSCDTVLPLVQLHTRFKPFIEDVFPALAKGKRALVAHPGDYPACPRGVSESLVLIVGPEGGFIPYEIERFEQADVAVVSLGPRILRVENAVTSLIGRLF